MKLEEIVATIEKFVKENKKVVRVQSGDPSIYGQYLSKLKSLKREELSAKLFQELAIE